MTNLEKLLPRKEWCECIGNCEHGKDTEGYNRALEDCLSALKGRVILVEDIDEGEMAELVDEVLSKYWNEAETLGDINKYIALSIHEYLKGLGG